MLFFKTIIFIKIFRRFSLMSLDIPDYVDRKDFRRVIASDIADSESGDLEICIARDTRDNGYQVIGIRSYDGLSDESLEERSSPFYDLEHGSFGFPKRRKSLKSLREGDIFEVIDLEDGSCDEYEII